MYFSSLNLVVIMDLALGCSPFIEVNGFRIIDIGLSFLSCQSLINIIRTRPTYQIGLWYDEYRVLIPVSHFYSIRGHYSSTFTPWRGRWRGFNGSIRNLCLSLNCRLLIELINFNYFFSHPPKILIFDIYKSKSKKFAE